MANEPTDEWRVSTEGDLDPDLTEEAGYGTWDPPRRSGWAVMYRVGLALILVLMIGGALSVFLR